MRGGSGALPRVVWVFALAALALKLHLAATTHGTNDVDAFVLFLRQYLGSGARTLYELESEFNHPPFILRFLLGLRWIVNLTGLPFGFWLRLPSILADVASLFLLARLVGGAAPARLLLVALAPVSVMVSGYHGNTDPLMIAFVLLSVFLLQRGAPAGWAGAALGMALNIKAVPVVFLPALVLWLDGWKRRAVFLAALAGVVCAGSWPILFEEPLLVARKVLGYPSAYGLWGVTRLLDFGPAWLDDAFRAAGRHVLALTLAGLALWMNSGGRKPAPLLQVGATAFVFLLVSPGFGVQYAAWLVPWMVLLPERVAWAHALSMGAFLFVVYSFWNQLVPSWLADPDWLGAEFWSRGLPWDHANADLVREWRGEIVILEVLAWLSVAVACACLLRDLHRARRARVPPGAPEAARG